MLRCAVLRCAALRCAALCCAVRLSPLDALVWQVSGSTALHLAARWGHVDVLMELLLRGGAEASVVDANGRTAEKVAAEYRRLRATVRRRLGFMFWAYMYIVCVRARTHTHVCVCVCACVCVCVC
eukprot:COSAG03_NODE_2099_length_3125_cov_32.812293_1_plen_125_part_00